MAVIMVIGFFILLTAGYGCLRGAPWLPTRQHDLDRVINCVDIGPGQTVYDLGCGDGRILFAVASRGARAVGYEVFLLPYLVARIRHLFSPYRRLIKIHWKDFYFADLSDADIIYVFLLPDFYKKIREKIQSSARKGATVIVHMWPIEEWVAESIDHPEGKFPIYVYKNT